MCRIKTNLTFSTSLAQKIPGSFQRFVQTNSQSVESLESIMMTLWASDVHQISHGWRNVIINNNFLGHAIIQTTTEYFKCITWNLVGWIVERVRLFWISSLRWIIRVWIDSLKWIGLSKAESSSRLLFLVVSESQHPPGEAVESRLYFNQA